MLQAKLFGESFGEVHKIIKGIYKTVRLDSLAKTRKVWSNDVEMLSQNGHELSKVVASARKTVQQQECRFVRVASFAVENGKTVLLYNVVAHNSPSNKGFSLSAGRIDGRAPQKPYRTTL